MKVTIELTHEELRDIATTATERYGCGYWARTEKSFDQALDEPVKVFDAEEPEKLLGVLTREKLEGAASVFATKAPRSQVVSLLEWPNAIDGSSADNFIQCALFGEIRYG